MTLFRERDRVGVEMAIAVAEIYFQTTLRRMTSDMPSSSLPEYTANLEASCSHNNRFVLR